MTREIWARSVYLRIRAPIEAPRSPDILTRRLTPRKWIEEFCRRVLDTYCGPCAPYSDEPLRRAKNQEKRAKLRLSLFPLHERVDPLMKGRAEGSRSCPTYPPPQETFWRQRSLEFEVGEMSMS